MLSYCLKCKKKPIKNKTKKTKQKNDSALVKSSSGKTMILSKCAIYGAKKLKFIKEQEAKGLLSNLGTGKPLSKIPLLGDILF